MINASVVPVNVKLNVVCDSLVIKCMICVAKFRAGKSPLYYFVLQSFWLGNLFFDLLPKRLVSFLRKDAQYRGSPILVRAATTCSTKLRQYTTKDFTN